MGMLGKYLEKIRAKRPLIHSITNFVTANDCANMLLACGASPVMADDPAEVEEITAMCSGLCINLGTLDSRRIPSMLLAGSMSNALKHPVVLDPVGAGISRLRTETAFKLIDELDIAIIRGNASEIKALASRGRGDAGVDADAGDRITPETQDIFGEIATDLARETKAVVLMTGEIDLVADGSTVYNITGGHPMMSRVTGTGCQLSAVTAAFAAVGRDNLLEAAAAAVSAMDLCGERAFKKLQPGEGNAAYRARIIDEMYNLKPEVMDMLRAKEEESPSEN